MAGIRTQPQPTCPLCGNIMILRRPPPGAHWNAFWGCSLYPVCKETVGIDPDTGLPGRMSEKSKPTPGPWDVVDGPVVHAGHGGRICQFWDRDECDFPNAEANAALIAAAPNLPEAARDARDWFDEMTSIEVAGGDADTVMLSLFTALDWAIKKAEGEL